MKTAQTATHLITNSPAIQRQTYLPSHPVRKALLADMLEFGAAFAARIRADYQARPEHYLHN